MDWNKVKDELCECGHKRSEHRNMLAVGHGECKKCKCRKFTWVAFLDAKGKKL